MKSHVSVLQSVLASLFMDCASLTSTDLTVDVRDLITSKSRLEHEGLSFITITLPNFGSDFVRCLDQGQVDSKLFRGFKKSQSIPSFLKGMTNQVFDSGTGKLLPEPSITAISCIWQLCNAFKKIKMPCTDARVKKAYGKYLADERDLSVSLPHDDVDSFVHVARHLWTELFMQQDRFNPVNMLGKHGPGAVAERYSPNEKYLMQRWHDRLEGYFPILGTVFPLSANFEELPDVTFVPPDDEEPVRVITVPKTLKTPRIIAIEPACMQFTQQAISSVLTASLERYWLTGGHINFVDQSINQRYAIKSSQDGRFATIDLSSASDRVPVSLAMRMFDSNPDLQGAIFACRSRTARLPNGIELELNKFASMGSALCFPIEAMYFYTICVKALLENRGLPVTPWNIWEVSRGVYVYGDDIIVPTDEVDAVVAHLQKYYCKVGADKSFWTGKFRESCGAEAYDGTVVTPVYIRSLPPNDRHDGSEALSWVAAGNQFYKTGFWRTARYIRKVVERALGPLPIVHPHSPGLGWHSFLPHVYTNRWNRGYQRLEVKTWVATPVYRKDTLDGNAALSKCLLNLEKRKSLSTKVDKRHLEMSVRRGSVSLKRRWVAAL